jgi:hypothetical protein
LLVFTQGFTKALYLVVSDLGKDGLGSLRASYCLDAMKKVERDAQEVMDALADQHLV